MLAWDTETFLIRDGLKAPPLVCLSWCTDPQTYGVVHRKDALRFFYDHMMNRPWVGAYLAYDMAVMIQQFPELTKPIFDKLARGEVHDIGIRQRLIDIARGFRKRGGKKGNPYRLEALAHRYLKWELEKDGGWRLRYGELLPLPVEQWPEGARRYAELDAVAPWMIFHEQEKRRMVSGYDVFVDEANQVRAEFVLHLMSAYGIKTDKEWAKQLDGVYAEEMGSVLQELQSLGLIRDTGAKNMKRAKELMVEALGSSCKITDKGLKLMGTGWTRQQVIDAGYISVDGEMCKASGNPALERLARYAHLQKLRGTYIEKILPHEVVHARYETLMDTGRTSCSNPPLQQLPREFGPRECFIPRPGHYFASTDYDKAELVSLAQVLVHLFGYSQLADALRNGFDPHLGMAATLMHISYQEAVERYKAGDKEVKRFRQMAKAANFGLPGGLGPDTFMIYARANYGVNISREEAVQIKRLWFQMWPEMHEYFRWAKSVLRSGGGKRATLLQFFTHRVRGRCKYTQICNTPFQGGCADGAKLALFELTRRQFCEPSSSLYGTHCVGFFHDEILAEFPISRAHECAMEMKEVMVGEYNRITTHVPVEASPALMERWHKEAEPVYENGRLVPWRSS